MNGDFFAGLRPVQPDAALRERALLAARPAELQPASHSRSWWGLGKLDLVWIAPVAFLLLANAVVPLSRSAVSETAHSARVTWAAADEDPEATSAARIALVDSGRERDSSRRVARELERM